MQVMRNWLTRVFPLIFPHVFPARFSRSFSRSFFPLVFPARFSHSFSLALRSFACFGAEFWFAPGVNFLCSDWSLWWIWSYFYDIHESKSAPMYNHVNVFLPTVINLHTNRCVRTIGKVRWQHAEGRVLLLLNPFTSKIFRNSPYCLQYSSHVASMENLVLDQLTIRGSCFIAS